MISIKSTRIGKNNRKDYQYISEGGGQKIQINERTKAEGESVNGANQQILCGSGEVKILQINSRDSDKIGYDSN